MKKQKGIKKFLVNNRIGIISILFVLVITGSTSLYEIREKNKYTERMNYVEQEYEKELKLSKELKEYEAYMKTDKYIEDIARTKLGMVYKNEIVFKEE